MFVKSVVATTLLAFAAGIVATEPASQCTGSLQCCDSTTSDMTPQVESLSLSQGFMGPGENVPLPIGLNCSPLSINVSGSVTCNAQPVCCENNKFNGVVVVGCSPVNLNL